MTLKVTVTAMILMWPGISTKRRSIYIHCCAGQHASFGDRTLASRTGRSRDVYVTNWSFVFPLESIFLAYCWLMY